MRSEAESADGNGPKLVAAGERATVARRASAQVEKASRGGRDEADGDGVSAPRRPAERPRTLLADPVFSRLFAGQGLLAISEQLYLVCLTLLVVDLAGTGATLGLVMAIAAIPRAVLLPLGGVLADRLPPVRIAVAAAAARTAVLALLALLTVVGPPPLAVVASLAGLLAALDAAAYPAGMTLLPRVVDRERLTPANALVQGAESAGDLIGPALAAGAVAAVGLGGALAGVAVLALLAALALVDVGRRLSRAPRPLAEPPTRPLPGLAALREGLSYSMRDPVVRTSLILLAVLNIAIAGPAIVGGAALAEQRLGGADQLGLVFAGFGAGSLAGLLAAGTRPPRRRGLVLIGATAALGAATAGLGLAQSLPAAAGLAALMGLGAAYLGVVLVAWLQERVPEALHGRVMSLVLLCAVALDPLSFALAGALLPAGLTILFAVCGALVVACAALAAASGVRGLR